MYIHLNSELENYINAKIQQGVCSTPSEFVVESLYRQKQQEDIYIRMLQTEVQKGIDSIDRGDYEDGEKVMDELMEEIDKYEN